MEQIKPAGMYGEASKSVEVNQKKPQDVIGFLREFNFGDRNETPRIAVGRFLEYMKSRKEFLESGFAMGFEKEKIPKRFRVAESGFVDMFIDELEKSGFANPGMISHEKWTPEAEQALFAALDDFEKLPDEKQKEHSAKHQDWGP